MDNNTLIVLLLVAVIAVSVIQTYQVMAFQNTVTTLNSMTTLGASAPAKQTSSSGVGGC